ncbi:MAG: hypothetical protein ABEJ79_04225 [Halolamina sp.]
MPSQDCRVCGGTATFADMVHVLVHTRTDAGVLDSYVCQDCYETDIEPLLA